MTVQLYAHDPMPAPVDPSLDSQGDKHADALYSVVAGEGDGFMLGLAAGDTAGGAWDLGYSATTEQATVLAYELIAHRRLDPDRVVSSVLELDGATGADEPVLRAESSELRAWLERARAGSAAPGAESSLDAAARGPVVGVAYRRDPIGLVDQAIALGRLFHSDASTVAAGVASAAAVAASCFAQSGLDLIAGVGEVLTGSLERIGEGLDRPERLDGLDDRIRSLMERVGIASGEEALAATGGDPDDPLQVVLAGLLIAAPVATRHHVPISESARLGGSRLGAIVGAIVGARVGIRAWPWAFANDTWFAEIGRRLVRGPDEVADLPIPYAVEQHLMSGGRPGFH